MSIFLLFVQIYIIVLQTTQLVENENNADEGENNLVENSFKGRNYYIQLQNNDQVLGFGFWSQCVPQLSHNIGLKYNVEDIIINKQFLLIFYNQFISLLVLVEFNKSNYSVKHTFHLTEINEMDELTFTFDPQKYEGSWLFNIIVFDQKTNQIQVQIAELESKSFTFYSKFSLLNITVGGLYTQAHSILDYFKGRLSLFEILYYVKSSQTLLSQFTSYKNLPSKNFHSQFEYIIKDVIAQNFFSTIIYQQGNWYAISGWIKLEVNFYQEFANVEAVRISSQQLNLENYGNLIFSLAYKINKSAKYLSNISISAEFHSFPLITEDRIYQKNFMKTFEKDYNSDVYQAIQEWHFFKYEFSEQSGGNLNIFFQNNLGRYSENLGDDDFSQSFINSKFFIYIGENLESYSQFYGQLAQIQFFHNDGRKLFQNLNNGCHFSCENCFGPFKSNCLSCKNSTNRILIEEINECSCQLGFMEFNNEDCMPYSDVYPTQIEEKELLQDHLCKFGYFLKPSLNDKYICLECPKNNQNEFYCLECILNSNLWYQQPYCQTYMHSRQLYNDDAYVIYQEQEEINFIIDEKNQNQFVILPLFLKFCDQCKYLNSLNLSSTMKNKIDKFKMFHEASYSDCFNISVYNLLCNNCLPNYYYDFFENTCVICHQTEPEFVISTFCLDKLPKKYQQGYLLNYKIHHYESGSFSCHQSCLECANFQICLRCKSSNKGRLLSLSSSLNECIECPLYCSLCIERTIEQIHSINPLFTNLKFSQYASQCLKESQDQNLFYDKELGQFIKCQNGKLCKKELFVKLNLHCSKDEYLQELQKLNFTQQLKFAQENILYEDLMTNKFSQFYNQEFYKKANIQSLRKISIFIYTQKAQTCQSGQIHLISNKFSENIFSAMYIQIIIIVRLILYYLFHLRSHFI